MPRKERYTEEQTINRRPQTSIICKSHDVQKPVIEAEVTSAEGFIPLVPNKSLIGRRPLARTSRLPNLPRVACADLRCAPPFPLRCKGGGYPKLALATSRLRQGAGVHATHPESKKQNAKTLVFACQRGGKSFPNRKTLAGFRSAARPALVCWNVNDGQVCGNRVSGAQGRRRKPTRILAIFGYSVRSVRYGSTEAARRAGNQAARKEMRSRTAVAAPSAIGSQG